MPTLCIGSVVDQMGWGRNSKMHAPATPQKIARVLYSRLMKVNAPLRIKSPMRSTSLFAVGRAFTQR